MIYPYKDERISALLDSENKLSVELTQKSETIQDLKNEINALKAHVANSDLLQPLINRIQNQKSCYDNCLKHAEHFANSADIKFFESVESQFEVKTQEDVKNLIKLSSRLQCITSKFNRAKYAESKKKMLNDLSTQTDSILQPQNRGQATQTSKNEKDVAQLTNQQQVADIENIHSEIFAQLENKVKSTLNFEIFAAIKKSTESFKNLLVTCPDCSGLNSRIDKLERELVVKDDLIFEKSSKIDEIKNKLQAKTYIINEVGFQIDAC